MLLLQGHSFHLPEDVLVTFFIFETSGAFMIKSTCPILVMS